MTLALVNEINKFLHSVSANFPPITDENPFLNHTIEYIIDRFLVSVEEVEMQLACIKLGKAAGPDGIHSWILRDLAPIVAPPVTAIVNSSIGEGYVPTKWKNAIVCP